MGDPLGSARVALLLVSRDTKHLPYSSETIVLGLEICRDLYAVSIEGLGESFPDCGRNSDSEFVLDSADGLCRRLP